jgi:hypothetical protein
MSDGSAGLLWQACKDDIIPAFPALHDFWGMKNLRDEETIQLIYAVYQKLCRRGLTVTELHDHFITNKLDELIHTNYKKYYNHESSYYGKFIKKKIVIGDTYINSNNINKEPSNIDMKQIELSLSNNMCPSCGCKNYSKNCPSPPDCAICFRDICEICSHIDNSKYSYVCYRCCGKENLIKRIEKKIAKFKKIT